MTYSLLSTMWLESHIVLKCLFLSKFFYSPTDTQVNWLKNNFKIHMKTTPTCFGSITIIRESIIRAC